MGFAADGGVYLGDDNGDVAVLQTGKEMKKISGIDAIAGCAGGADR